MALTSDNDGKQDDTPSPNFSRRDFMAGSLAAGLAAASSRALGRAALPVIDIDVEVKTPDGVCDAAFIHPAKSSHPGYCCGTIHPVCVR